MSKKKSVTYDDVMKAMPRESVIHTVYTVRADRNSKGWEVTMGLDAGIADPYLLLNKPCRLVLFLFDGAEFDAAYERLTTEDNDA